MKINPTEPFFVYSICMIQVLQNEKRHGSTTHFQYMLYQYLYKRLMCVCWFVCWSSFYYSVHHDRDYARATTNLRTYFATYFDGTMSEVFPRKSSRVIASCTVRLLDRRDYHKIRHDRRTFTSPLIAPARIPQRLFAMWPILRTRHEHFRIIFLPFVTHCTCAKPRKICVKNRCVSSCTVVIRLPDQPPTLGRTTFIPPHIATSKFELWISSLCGGCASLICRNAKKYFHIFIDLGFPFAYGDVHPCYNTQSFSQASRLL